VQAAAEQSDGGHSGGAHAHGVDDGGKSVPDDATEPDSGDTAAKTSNGASAAFQKQLGALLAAYFEVSGALASDDFDAASKATASAAATLKEIDASQLDDAGRTAWEKELASLEKALGDMQAAKKIEPMRSAFALLSDELAVVVKRFGVGDKRPVYRIHCPMAFNDRGADWLNDAKKVRNPYYGAAMLQCGFVKETLAEE
jgi:Cu(I)/Ag(I) efflux system membrane fusion protein